MHIVYAWARNEDKSIEKFDKELKQSIESFYHLYMVFFQLLLDIRHHMHQRIEQKKEKYFPTEDERNPNIRFIQNPVLESIEENDKFNSSIGKLRSIWNDTPELIRKLSLEVQSSEFFTRYMEKTEAERSDHKDILINVLTEIFANSDDLFETLEEKSVYWNDDIELVLSMNIRTIERVKPNYRVRIMDLYKNQADKDFVTTLFRKTVLNYQAHQEKIKESAKNWDIERIALMDKVIMALGITELDNFPEIPVRVTLNEYIDMAKFYSTEKSSTFVNGVLDKILTKMKEENRLNKIDGAVFDKRKPNNQ